MRVKIPGEWGRGRLHLTLPSPPKQFCIRQAAAWAILMFQYCSRNSQIMVSITTTFEKKRTKKENQRQFQVCLLNSLVPYRLANLAHLHMLGLLMLLRQTNLFPSLSLIHLLLSSLNDWSFHLHYFPHKHLPTFIFLLFPCIVHG